MYSICLNGSKTIKPRHLYMKMWYLKQNSTKEWYLKMYNETFELCKINKKYLEILHNKIYLLTLQKSRCPYI